MRCETSSPGLLRSKLVAGGWSNTGSAEDEVAHHGSVDALRSKRRAEHHQRSLRAVSCSALLRLRRQHCVI